MSPARHHPTRTSPRGITWIILREGVRLNAYRDSIGVPTIGIGHTQGVRMGQKITMAQARMFLRGDLAQVEAFVCALNLPDQGMFDACVSLGFNLGTGIFATSHDVGRELHARRWQTAADTFLEYDKAGGRVLLGLRSRRRSERRQFLRGLRAFQRRQSRRPTTRS